MQFNQSRLSLLTTLARGLDFFPLDKNTLLFSPNLLYFSLKIYDNYLLSSSSSSEIRNLIMSSSITPLFYLHKPQSPIPKYPSISYPMKLPIYCCHLGLSRLSRGRGTYKEPVVEAGGIGNQAQAIDQAAREHAFLPLDLAF